jgi:preprotein translocase subunit SecD
MYSVLILAVFLAVALVAAAIGGVVARWAGRPGHFWRIALPAFWALLSVMGIWAGWPPRPGLDLDGGVRLVYEVHWPEDAESDPVRMFELVRTVQRRIDSTGSGGALVRPDGPATVEILIPKVLAADIEEIQKRITTTGHLRFRILANEQADAFVISCADDPKQAKSHVIKDRDGQPVAEWVKIARDADGRNRLGLAELAGHKTRTDPRTGENEILMLIDPFDCDGRHLARAWAGYDSRMRNCIHFTMTRRGARLFGAVTGMNLPDKQTGLYRHLGIIMDDRVISAPRISSRISERGQITGDFTTEEVEFIADVLYAGHLPAYLDPVPIVSEQYIRSEMKVRWSVWTPVVTLALLLVFGAGVAWRYGRHGVAAAGASWLAAAVLAAGLLAASVRFTLASVVVACAFVLVLATGLALLCRWTRNGRVAREAARRAPLPASTWLPWVLFVFALVVLPGVLAYITDLFGARPVAAVLVLGAISGMVSVVFCFWPLKECFAASSDREGAEAGVVMAQVCEEDSG